MSKYKIQNEKRWAVALAISMLVLLTSGCGQFGNSSKSTSLPELYVGTEGLVAEFAPESVPSLVTAGSSFDVVILISNKGAADIPAAAIVTVKDSTGSLAFESAKGSEKITFGKSLITTTAPLEGKESSKTATGSFDGVTLTVNAKEFVKNEDAIDTGLLATACYEDATKLTANVCVDASSYSFQKQRKPCDAKVPIVLKSQGAPVAVKKVETLIEKSGNIVRPKFKIYIGNVGNGLIIDKNNLNLFCTDQNPVKDTNNKINLVYVDSVVLNGKPLQCVDEDTTDKLGVTKTLSGNSNSANDFILCAYNYDDFKEGDGAFATPLKVKLSYGYTSTSNPVPVRVEKGFGSIAEGAPKK